MGTPELTIDGHLAVIKLRRPDQANRLGPDDLQTIFKHLQTVNDAPEVRVLRIESEGKYFCSGFDIKKLGGERVVDFEDVVDRLETLRPVTIAVLHGGVYGGATDLALACDFRVGSDKTNMFMPAARLGLHYYESGMERYVQRLGINTAKRLFLTAEQIDAQEMLNVGYLTHLVESESLGEKVANLTATLIAMAPLACLGMKKHLTRISQGKLDRQDLEKDIKVVMASEDLQEGRTAWSEKRKPVFKGR
ncbi:enoyl-CoA hydratase/isomerase family protein [Orrella marina]|uniref:3-hydroxybutyryl-CoA dehydratase n=1 Tax=Orrella marina TaxID=2163011 RepID=A0A2R4XII0_9BURK|nr:enoyl-CoA hydratase/isomerase family protein [Orrella marina]AWB33632.1 3-hydroxybutyryl-CoA dehydratase [Orrella marina]